VSLFFLFVFVHVWGRKSRSSVIKNRKSFHLVHVFSRQWQLINFRMHRSDDCRSWNFITNINNWAHVSFDLVFRECKHIKNIFEDVFFSKNLFHITLKENIYQIKIDKVLFLPNELCMKIIIWFIDFVITLFIDMIY
jgi:hypothetical protein